MSRTANLRRQHDAAVTLVTRITERAEALEEDGVPYEVGMMLAKLTGTLRIHFAQEDRTLYPHMIASAHPDASATAAAFQAEMGGLSGRFEAFAARWQSATLLAADPSGFRAEAAAVFGALAQRIEREDSQLYPLADAIEDWQVRRTA
jgi:hemerythrin-like domain-containing protein